MCVYVSTVSNINSFETSGAIAITFFLKYHWGGRKAAIVLGQIYSALVSLATDSPHMVIIGKTVLPLFLGCFSSDHFYTCR